MNAGETVKNNDNNIEHNNDEKKLCISRIVLWASARDINKENNNDNKTFSNIITKKIEEGFFLYSHK